jgi:hypothetical protein
MVHEFACNTDIARLRGPALVAWLVENTERLVLVASALEERASDLAPSVQHERVAALSQSVRRAALEITVSLLALLTKSGPSADGALAEAIAGAHVRVQQLASAVPVQGEPKT